MKHHFLFVSLVFTRQVDQSGYFYTREEKVINFIYFIPPQAVIKKKEKKTKHLGHSAVLWRDVILGAPNINPCLVRETSQAQIQGKVQTAFCRIETARIHWSV